MKIFNSIQIPIKSIFLVLFVYCAYIVILH
nr:MAG TPA: hypothetical protein [Caudoviricetes sp.]